MMPAQNLDARQLRKYRDRQLVVGTIFFIRSLSNQGERNAVMVTVLENSKTHKTVLASRYIYKDSKVHTH